MTTAEAKSKLLSNIISCEIGCDVLMHIADNREPWLQETEPDSMCETFEVKHD